jgi:hypothetical protein
MPAYSFPISPALLAKHLRRLMERSSTNVNLSSDLLFILICLSRQAGAGLAIYFADHKLTVRSFGDLLESRYIFGA